MKKIIFLLIAVLTVGFYNTKADVAPPVFEEKYVEVTLDGTKEVGAFTEVVTNINNLNGVTQVYFNYENGSNYHLVAKVREENAINEISKITGVSKTEYVEDYKTKEECKCDQSKTSSECLNNDDVDKLQTTTYIVYITEIILLVLIVIIIILMLKKRKNNKKEN